MFNKVDNFEVSGLVVRLNASLLAFWIFWRVGVLHLWAKKLMKNMIEKQILHIRLFLI